MSRDSSGLPLRAIVMVLLFLGVVFFLVGLQAMGGGDSDDEPTVATPLTTTKATPTPSAEPEVRAEVRVYNISEVEGAAGATADRLREAGIEVAETGNLAVEGVPVTTVYYGDGEGEKETADEVGRVLEAPVELRTEALAEQPPGVVVLVTG
ncbi:LytR C-terminal domain-containing protein [uncultured Mycolicibacterium sp.]|uniref:LytR C-terminal domain-containing protein n=1 Tax=uncultured Mycolicibacterium sp. TaxID=2320817 RepID=UPI002607C916|nr:LytR C-terminal domain-containing protein [uncultured Mycolicibacterium sp.]